MPEEAVDVIRVMITGRQVSHRGPHYTVENARLYAARHGRLPIHVSGLRPQACAPPVTVRCALDGVEVFVEATGLSDLEYQRLVSRAARYPTSAPPPRSCR
ncbi:hypothetical protein [Streptomyces sp. NPDC085540]|uniref:hypothetical protein n=1 Tax=Streptomyces sp. NPDC085540 TaxID=3365730 RepID=UPI0037D340A4